MSPAPCAFLSRFKPFLTRKHRFLILKIVLIGLTAQLEVNKRRSPSTDPEQFPALLFVLTRTYYLLVILLMLFQQYLRH